MDLVAEIRRFLQHHRVEPCPLLAAVSGGPDSTALLLALLEIREDGFTVAAAHVNHHLRGEASDLDEEFVRRICAEHSVPLHVADGTLHPKKIRESGVEAAAREVRYAELQRLKERTGAALVVTAHHLDDQAETVIMRMITGRNVERLGGIAPKTRTGVIRPLLTASRSDLAAFLKDRGVEPRVDETNAEYRFLRNRVRNDLMPLLAEYNPRVTENLAALASSARERNGALDFLLTESLSKWVKQTASTTEILLDQLPENDWLRRAVLWREIRRLDPGTREVSATDLARLADGLPTMRRVTVTAQLELIRTGETVTLRQIAESPQAFERTLRPGGTVHVNGVSLRLERHGATAPPFTNKERTFQTFQLPDGANDEPFIVRSRRRGERFHPLGLTGEKKLNEFLIDRKIPRELREQIPLLTWRNEVVWVAGVEVSEKFKVAEPWRDAYQIAIIRNEDSAGFHR